MRSRGHAVVAAMFLLLAAQLTVRGQVAQLPQESCGNEGEIPCPLTSTNARCDTGLRVSAPRNCGCTLRGPLGNCLIPKLCFVCEDHTRRRASINAFASSWTAWALRNQRELAVDEPLNWVMHVGTHNSFNTASDGHTAFPNQYYSMTDQLRSGARMLSLDVYMIDGNARLCHSFSADSADEVCAAPGDLTIYPLPPALRYFANGIKEIRKWVVDNPSEIIIIDLENYVPPAQDGHLLDPLTTYLGSRIFDPPLVRPAGFTARRWPTRRELLAARRRVIVIDNDGGAPERPRRFDERVHVGSFDESWLAKNAFAFPYCGRMPFTADADSNLFLSDVDNIGLANGDRVVLKPVPLAGPLPAGVDDHTTYHVRDVVRGENEDGDFVHWTFRLAATEGGPAIDLTGDLECRVENAAVKQGTTCGILGKAPSSASHAKFSLLVEERELGTTLFGTMDADAVADAVECNTNFVVLDRLSHANSVPPAPHRFDITDFSRQAAAVWSWRVNDRGQFGDCAMLDAGSGRWASANCEVPQRFACARPRSESGLDPLAWEDPLGESWRITASAAPWDQGHTVCQTEFPGSVFGVPVNGYQNRMLNNRNAFAPADLWLNYNDREVESKWVIGRAPATNAPPVADAGPDQMLTCGARVRLDGTASSDRERDPLTYTWTGPFGTLHGPIVKTMLPLGEHALLLTVTDSAGGTDTDSVTVTVSDTTPPKMMVTLSPAALWPPNHQMVPVVANILVKDSCDAEPPAVELVSITSNQPGNGNGDGKTSPDIEGAEIGTDDREFQLRAERGGREERVYRVIYRATDLSGNVTEEGGKVKVANMRKR